MNCPRYVAKLHPGNDTLSRSGAEQIASTIRMAWAKVGHDVPVQVVQIDIGRSGATFSVRMPTLVNGRPYS